MDIKELLPIGSIVMLKGADHAIMIFGIKQTSSEDAKEYDYIGVPYPEGNMGTNTQFLFMHENIDEVFFRGFEDDSRTEFIEKLEQFYNK